MLLSLNKDSLQIIFMMCPISDKRTLLRTCRQFYKLAPLMKQIESNFQQMIDRTNYFHDENFNGFDNSLYKYTIELIHDGYYHLILDKYFIPENRILHQYLKIWYYVGI